MRPVNLLLLVALLVAATSLVVVAPAASASVGADQYPWLETGAAPGCTGDSGAGPERRPAAARGLRAGQPLWAAGAAARVHGDMLSGSAAHQPAPPLPGMSTVEIACADAWSTGITPDLHPVEFSRLELRRIGARAIADLDNGTRVLVAGAVSHRQRPPTATGVTLLSLEDETGLLNVVCSVGLYKQVRTRIRDTRDLLVRGSCNARTAPCPSWSTASPDSTSLWLEDPGVVTCRCRRRLMWVRGR